MQVPGIHHTKQEDLEMFSGNDFGDKVSFTVGSSFTAGFLLGLGKGIKGGIPKSFKMPRKLIMNNFFNSVGKQTSRLGNAFASAGLMYYLIGNSLNWMFADQLQDVIPLYKNMLCGAITGGLYKSTLGFVPAIVGSVLGSSIIGGLSLLVEQGNRRGYVAFQMKF